VASRTSAFWQFEQWRTQSVLTHPATCVGTMSMRPLANQNATGHVDDDFSRYDKSVFMLNLSDG